MEELQSLNEDIASALKDDQEIIRLSHSHIALMTKDSESENQFQSSTGNIFSGRQRSNKVPDALVERQEKEFERKCQIFLKVKGQAEDLEEYAKEF